MGGLCHQALHGSPACSQMGSCAGPLSRGLSPRGAPSQHACRALPPAGPLPGALPIPAQFPKRGRPPEPRGMTWAGRRALLRSRSTFARCLQQQGGILALAPPPPLLLPPKAGRPVGDSGAALLPPRGFSASPCGVARLLCLRGPGSWESSGGGASPGPRKTKAAPSLGGTLGAGGCHKLRNTAKTSPYLGQVN